MSTENNFRLVNVIFNELLSQTNQEIRYDIPLYQRGYVWQEEQWDTLFAEINKIPSDSVFMGVIICIESIIGAGKIVREVVDGQQRITTMYLLLIAIWKKLGKLAVAELDKEEPVQLAIATSVLPRIKKMLLDNENHFRITPAIVNNNQDDLKYIMNTLDDYDKVVTNVLSYISNRKLHKLISAQIHTTIPTPSNTSVKTRMLYKCLEFFENKLPNDVDGIVRIFENCEKLQFVLIVALSKTKGYYLFQVLNDRGVDLSEMDIIKSYIFGNFKISESAIQLHHTRWVEIESKLKTATLRERFFRHLYNAWFRFEYAQPSVTRRTLIDEYSKLIDKKINPKNGMLAFYEKIIMGADEYIKFVDFENDTDLTIEIKNDLTDLFNIEASTAYVLLLYVRKLVIEKDLSDDEGQYRKLLNFLIAYYTRRNITNIPSTNQMDPFVVNLVGDIDENKLKDWDSIISFVETEYMKLGFETKANFTQKLKDIDMYKKHRDILMTLFLRLEDHMDTTRAVNARAQQLTIEHIHPQKPRQGIPAWGDDVGRIGNLTLLNPWEQSKLSNADFVSKRDYTDKNGQLKGFKAARFYLHSIKFPSTGVSADINIATADMWTKEFAAARANSIIQVLFDCNILSLPGDK